MAPPNKAQAAVSLLIFCTCSGLAIGFVIFMAESDKQYYTVEITGIKPADSTTTSPSPSPPSFNVTMRIDNRYRHDLYIKDWDFSLWLDGVPLGRGSFPYDLTADSMSGTTVTGTTSTALVGFGISSGSKPMEDLELQVDTRFSVIDLDISLAGFKWHRCSARFGDLSAPSPCPSLAG